MGIHQLVIVDTGITFQILRATHHNYVRAENRAGAEILRVWTPKFDTATWPILRFFENRQNILVLIHTSGVNLDCLMGKFNIRTALQSSFQGIQRVHVYSPFCRLLQPAGDTGGRFFRKGKVLPSMGYTGGRNYREINITSDPTHSMVVIWVNIFKTEQKVEIHQVRLTEICGKILMPISPLKQQLLSNVINADHQNSCLFTNKEHFSSPLWVLIGVLAKFHE